MTHDHESVEPTPAAAMLELADLLHAQADSDSELVGMLVAEPVGSTVAICAWMTGEHQRFQVVAVPEGDPIDDYGIAREACSLVAMVESLKELAQPGASYAAVQELRDWQRASTDTPPAVATALQDLTEALERLARGAAPATSLPASPQRIDELGGLYRDLEAQWEIVTPLLETWSTALSGDALARVEALWQILAVIIRGPLSVPVSVQLHRSRESGLAFAEEAFSHLSSGQLPHSTSSP